MAGYNVRPGSIRLMGVDLVNVPDGCRNNCCCLHRSVVPEHKHVTTTASNQTESFFETHWQSNYAQGSTSKQTIL